MIYVVLECTFGKDHSISFIALALQGSPLPAQFCSSSCALSLLRFCCRKQFSGKKISSQDRKNLNLTSQRASGRFMEPEFLQGNQTIQTRHSSLRRGRTLKWSPIPIREGRKFTLSPLLTKIEESSRSYSNPKGEEKKSWIIRRRQKANKFRAKSGLFEVLPSINRRALEPTSQRNPISGEIKITNKFH